MLKARIYATREDAERAISAIDAGRHPDGVEEVTLPDGTTERRPAKTWALPIELEDGRCAVPWKECLSALAGREVTVRGERLRVPRAQDVSEIEIATDDGEPIVRDGRPVLREKGLRRDRP